jgi:hypothetical protein
LDEKPSSDDGPPDIGIRSRTAINIQLCLQLVGQEIPKTLQLTTRQPPAPADQTHPEKYHAYRAKDCVPRRWPPTPRGLREQKQKAAHGHQPAEPNKKVCSGNRMKPKSASDVSAAGPSFEASIKVRRKRVANLQRTARKEPKAIPADLRYDRPFGPRHPASAAFVLVQTPEAFVFREVGSVDRRAHLH